MHFKVNFYFNIIIIFKSALKRVKKHSLTCFLTSAHSKLLSTLVFHKDPKWNT